MAHDLKFNEDDTIVKTSHKKNPPGIISWLVKKKIVSSREQANALLIVFILIGIAAIIYINLRTFGA